MPDAQTARRKTAPAEGTGRQMQENAVSEASGSNAALLFRGFSIPSVSSGPSRRDTFRQCKPNTSRSSACDRSQRLESNYLLLLPKEAKEVTDLKVADAASNGKLMQGRQLPYSGIGNGNEIPNDK